MKRGMYIVAWMTRTEEHGDVDHWEVFSDKTMANNKVSALMHPDVYCWIQGWSYDGSEPHYIEGETVDS